MATRQKLLLFGFVCTIAILVTFISQRDLSYVLWLDSIIARAQNHQMSFDWSTSLPTPPGLSDVSDLHYLQATNATFWDQAPKNIYHAFAQHKIRTIESCNNSCSDSIQVCRLTTYKEWNNYVSKGLLPYRPFLARGQYVFEWEKHLLSYPPLKDLKTLPSLTLSRVYVGNKTQGEVRCNIFDTVHGRVDLVDEYGRLRTTGDDEVRVWIRSLEKKDFVASGDVTDQKNGSYAFTFKCLWPGKSKINVAVTYPREFLRVVNHQIHIGVTRYISMEFKRGNITEHTPCWGTPNIPGRPCVCNITDNGQETFYCGRPKDARLSCDDWFKSKRMAIPPPHEVTSAEKTLISSSSGKAESRCIRHNLSLSTEVHGLIPQLPPCHKADFKSTWTKTKPRGYWSPKFQWNSLVCEQKQNASTEWALSCLKNKTLWIFGDSNAHRTYMNILQLTGCHHVLGNWPQRSNCSIPERDIKLMFTPHENPRYSELERPHHYGSLAHLVDTLIPSTGNHICVFHFYLHYVLAHYSLVYLRLKALRGALERLLTRNPHVVVAFRGPHIVTKDFDWNHSLGGDTLAPKFIDMIHEWFHGLESKVIFLDAWDMSIGSENGYFHPSLEFSRELMKTLLSFACE